MDNIVCTPVTKHCKFCGNYGMGYCAEPQASEIRDGGFLNSSSCEASSSSRCQAMGRYVVLDREDGIGEIVRIIDVESDFWKLLRNEDGVLVEQQVEPFKYTEYDFRNFKKLEHGTLNLQVALYQCPITKRTNLSVLDQYGKCEYSNVSKHDTPEFKIEIPKYGISFEASFSIDEGKNFEEENKKYLNLITGFLQTNKEYENMDKKEFVEWIAKEFLLK